MTEEASGRRPKRRCVASKTAVPSAVHYVGYVEDDETPEMIMRKFEELNKVRDGLYCKRLEAQSSLQLQT